MISPYLILNIKQDSDKKQILKAQILAMKNKIYTLQEIAKATKILLDPSKRLAADFMFPAKIKAKRPSKISVDFQFEEITLNDINENAFDSI
jgi:hypothetical protein